MIIIWGPSQNLHCTEWIVESRIALLHITNNKYANKTLFRNTNVTPLTYIRR